MSSETDLFSLLQALHYEDFETDMPDDLLPFIGFLINKAAQNIVGAVNERMAEFGITSRHYGVMLLLSRNAGLPQSVIGEKLRIDRTTMVKLVDTLEKQGYVERHRDPNDRRAYALSLSPNGRDVLPEISQRAIDVEKTSLSHLSQDEIRALFRILVKLVR